MQKAPQSAVPDYGTALESDWSAVWHWLPFLHGMIWLLYMIFRGKSRKIKHFRLVIFTFSGNIFTPATHPTICTMPGFIHRKSDPFVGEGLAPPARWSNRGSRSVAQRLQACSVGANCVRPFCIAAIPRFRANAVRPYGCHGTGAVVAWASGRSKPLPYGRTWKFCATERLQWLHECDYSPSRLRTITALAVS